MSGSAQLREIIRRVRAIPSLIEKTAPACAQAFDAQVRAELAAGHAPGGAQWQPTKEGKAPLRNASSAGTLTKSVGTTIVTSVRGHYFYHHAGLGGVPVRSVLPQELSPALADAIRRPLVKAFEENARG